VAAISGLSFPEMSVRGMVSALVRGRVWYLSMFFVLHGDLGRALLERALAYGEARGAEVRSVWASLDPRAQARYVMAGRNRGRRGKRDGARSRRLRFPARGAGRLRLPNRRARGLPRLAAVRPA